MAKVYKCPECEYVSNVKAWNASTKEHFGENIYLLQESPYSKTSLYTCPLCSKDVTRDRLEEM